jgi:phage-related holin
MDFEGIRMMATSFARDNIFLIILLGLQALDLATGLLKATVRKEVSSVVSKVGIAQKGAIILFILAGSIFQPVFQAATQQDAVRLGGC